MTAGLEASAAATVAAWPAELRHAWERMGRQLCAACRRPMVPCRSGGDEPGYRGFEPCACGGEDRMPRPMLPLQPGDIPTGNPGTGRSFRVTDRTRRREGGAG